MSLPDSHPAQRPFPRRCGWNRVRGLTGFEACPLQPEGDSLRGRLLLLEGRVRGSRNQHGGPARGSGRLGAWLLVKGQGGRGGGLLRLDAFGRGDFRGRFVLVERLRGCSRHQHRTGRARRHLLRRQRVLTRHLRRKNRLRRRRVLAQSLGGRSWHPHRFRRGSDLIGGEGPGARCFSDGLRFAGEGSGTRCRLGLAVGGRQVLDRCSSGHGHRGPLVENLRGIR